MDQVKMALAGVGGFGRTHVDMALALANEGLAQVMAYAEPGDVPEADEKLGALGAQRYTRYEDLLTEERELDLVCIATPIPCHVPMARAAIARGLHVFLEKPPAVRIQDLRTLIHESERAGVYCTVGFQDIARPTVLGLKRALGEGALGKVQAVHAEARWHRAKKYYARTPWAGKTRMGDDYVLDGPMNNACAHVLNVAAFLAGPDRHSFARPVRVQGELYRANTIDGEDTDCLRAEMDTGVTVCVHLTQCATESHPRSWRVIGEKGEALLHDTDGVTLPGRDISPDSSEERPNLTLLRRLVEVVQGTDEPLLMPLAEAEGYLLLSNGAYESAGAIRPIPEEYTTTVDTEHGPAVLINDIDRVAFEAARSGKLLSECGAPWAVGTEPFDLAGFTNFPQRWQA